jgi:hypothetical protein
MKKSLKVYLGDFSSFAVWFMLDIIDNTIYLYLILIVHIEV